MIEITRQFAAKAAALWRIVGQPDRTDWVPGVSSCEFDGEIRRMSMQGAGVISERILSVDDALMTIEYSCIESAAPLQKHLASIQVNDDGDTCVMIWKTEVEPVEFEPFIVDQMNQSLEQLAVLLEK